MMSQPTDETQVEKWMVANMEHEFRMEDEAFEKTGVDKEEFEENMPFFQTDPEVMEKMRAMMMLL